MQKPLESSFAAHPRSEVEAAPAETGTTRPDSVIFVHGTGAADAADTGALWWQAGSVFGRHLSALLTPQAVVDKPFHWSGLNSEMARRAAGAALFDHLERLEEQKRTYHLVGHSHGGSVIWNALLVSARKGRPLPGLLSWTTVGTPFLTFRPIMPSLWRWFAAAVLSGLLIWLLLADPRLEWISAVRQVAEDGLYWRLIYVGFFFAGLVLLFAIALLRIQLPLMRVLADIFARRAEAHAAREYGQRWLAITHALDEPVNGLAATVGNGPQIAPRIGATGIWGVIPFVGPIINGVLAQAADEFAWAQITSRVQGADWRGYKLVNVSRTPPALAPGFDCLGAPFADAMERSADSKSPESMHRLRAVLAGAYERQAADVVLDRFSTVVSFQEVIHTSYFDHAQLAEIIAPFILSRARQARPTAMAAASTTGIERSGPDAPRAPTRSTLIANPVRHWARLPVAIEFVTAVAFLIGPGLLFALGGASAYFNAIAPYTAQFQVSSILAGLKKGDSETPQTGELIARMADLGEVADPAALLLTINNGKAKPVAHPAVVAWLAKHGRWADIERLTLANVYDDGDLWLNALRFKLWALRGMTAAGPQPAATFWQDFERDVTQLLNDTLRIGTLQIYWPDVGSKLQELSQTGILKRVLDASPPERASTSDPAEHLERIKCNSALGAAAAGAKSDDIKTAIEQNCKGAEEFRTATETFLNQGDKATAGRFFKAFAEKDKEREIAMEYLDKLVDMQPPNSESAFGTTSSVWFGDVSHAYIMANRWLRFPYRLYREIDHDRDQTAIFDKLMATAGGPAITTKYKISKYIVAVALFDEWLKDAARPIKDKEPFLKLVLGEILPTIPVYLQSYIDTAQELRIDDFIPALTNTLDGFGRHDAARQMLRDFYAGVRARVASPDVRVASLREIYEAATAIEYRDLAVQALTAALDQVALVEGRGSPYTIAPVVRSGLKDPVLRKKAIGVAERLFADVRFRDARSLLAREMADYWIDEGRFDQARRIATASADPGTIEVAILNRIMRDRGIGGGS